jgi:hypothetical protein
MFPSVLIGLILCCWELLLSEHHTHVSCTSLASKYIHKELCDLVFSSCLSSAEFSLVVMDSTESVRDMYVCCCSRVGLVAGDRVWRTGLVDGDLDLIMRPPCRAIRARAVPGPVCSNGPSSCDFDFGI